MRRIVSALVVVAAIAAASASFAGEKHAEYDGYCPVAYVAMGKAVKGDPDVTAEFAGHKYVFVKAEAKTMFEADPSKYVAAYDGYCATAVSMGKKLESDPTIFEVVDGTTYLFSSDDAKKMFDADTAKTAAKADEQWALINPSYGGHCPVAYIKMNKAVKGQENISSEYYGHTIRFANADAKKMFDSEPTSYKVAYGGHCATAMSMGKLFPSDPTVFIVGDGVTYLFSSEKAKEMFEADSGMVIGKADKEWASAAH
jgi:YHS domain-containing protein